MLQHRVVMLALCAALPLASSAHAQGKSGYLGGTVTDPSQAAVSGAQVQLRSLADSRSYEVRSDGQGSFSFPNLSAGSYVLTVRRQGFPPVRRTVTVAEGSSLQLPVVLSLASVAESVKVEEKSPLLTESPAGQTQVVVSRDDIKDTPSVTIADALNLLPGVTFVQGNGPRDIAISVRGSSVRQNYGVRNVQIFEDGFPVTQPDGLARTDLIDPHAYSGLEVVEGPSSALYGNYATGGALNFRTRPGKELHGFELGSDFGSFGYYNDYLSYGNAGRNYEAFGFLSNVRADQATAHNSFNTITANLLASFQATEKDRFTVKFINNDLDTDLSFRLSFNQYRQNPYQRNCATAGSSAAGCATISVFQNGYNGNRQSLTAEESGVGRHDRRTIFGLRWEHELMPQLLWRTQFTFDNRDANQPTSSTTYRGTLPSYNVTSELTRKEKLRGQEATSYAMGFFNYENISSLSANLMPGGNARVGGQTQTVSGKHLNTGSRFRQELALSARWLVVAGAGVEYTALNATATNFTYPIAATQVITPVVGDRTFWNAAPEASVQYRASDALRLHARVGTGYGTPQATQLFTTAQGTYGNNTLLKTQRNVGLDWGAEWTPSARLHISAAGFYEWFRNEMVTQSAGVNLQSYTFNAPSSEHRGLQTAFDWRPLAVLSGARLRASYLYNNQIYTDYTERLTTGSVTAAFSRNGNRIPGVQPHYLNGRALYDQSSGLLQGLGGYLEANWRDTYLLDNANLLKVPGYTLLNLSVHYDPPADKGLFSRLHFFFDLQNLADRTYVASANILTNSLNANGQQNGASAMEATTGSIYAGTRRSSFGGVRLRF